MAEFDPQDRLNDACRNSDLYPYTLLTKTTSRAVLEGYRQHLAKKDADLFDSSKEHPLFWEAWPATQSTTPTLVQVSL